MLVSRSARLKVSPAERFRRTTSPSRLVIVRSPRSSRESITAWATVDFPLPDSPVKKSTSPCSLGPRLVGVDDRCDVVGVVALTVAEGQDGVGAGVRRDHVHAELVVEPRRRRGRREVRRPRRPRAACARRRGRPAAGRPERGRVSRDRSGPAARPGVPSARSRSISSTVSASTTGTKVAPAWVARTCGRRQVEPPERAVLGVGQGLDRTVGSESRQWKPLGVDQLHRLALRARAGGSR